MRLTNDIRGQADVLTIIRALMQPENQYKGCLQANEAFDRKYDLVSIQK